MTTTLDLVDMKRLVRKAFLFLLILVVLCSIFYQFNQYLFRSITPSVDQETKIVSCGSSLSQYALSDSIIPDFQNFSLEGKTGLETYKTAKAILDNNPHIQSVVVDFAVMGVIGYRDYSYFIPIFAQKQFENTYPIASLSDLKAYPLNPKYYFLNQLRNEWVPNIDYLKKWWNKEEIRIDTKFPYLGEYQPKQGSRNNWNMEGWMERMEMLRNLAGADYPMSTVDLSYMDSLVNYTEKKDVELLVFVAPLHQDIVELVPSVYWNRFRGLISKAQEYSHVHAFDFTKFPLADSAYINFTHINEAGARVVSRAFQDSLVHYGLSEATPYPSEMTKREDGI